MIVLGAAAVLAAIPHRAAGAQNAWRIAIELAETRYHGVGTDTSSDSLGAFRPYRPGAFGVGLERGGTGARFGLMIRFSSTRLALGDRGLVLVAEDSPVSLIELRPVVSLPLLRIGGGALRAEFAPLIDRWHLPGEASRLRLGGEVGAALEAPLGRRATLLVRAGLAFSGSLFNDEDLLDGFVRRHATRRLLAAGLTFSP